MPKKSKVQQAIQKSFEQLVDDIGFDRITVKAICDQASVHRSTFYLHYRDKYDLRDKISQEFLEEINGFFTEENHLYPITNSGEIGIDKEQFINLLKFIKKNKKYAQYLLSVEHNNYTVSKFKDLFLDTTVLSYDDVGLEASEHPTIPLDYLTELSIDCVISVIQRWLIKDCIESPLVISDIIDDVLQRIVYWTNVNN